VLDLEPGFAAALAEREKAQRAAFVATVAKSLGVVAEAGASVDSLRASRAETDRRAHLPQAVLLAALAVAVAVWPLRAAGHAGLSAAAAGALLNPLLFRGLIAWQGIRVSLSAINHDEDVAPYFGRLLALDATATLVALAIVTLVAARHASGRTALLGLAAITGAGLGLLLPVLAAHAAQDLFMRWTIGDIDATFQCVVSLHRLRSTGLAALAVPVFALLADRLFRQGTSGA